MNKYNSMEEYADHVRRETSRILGAVCNRFGASHDVAQAVAGLCTEAAGIVHQTQMQRETGADYDLTSLRISDEPRSGE